MPGNVAEMATDAGAERDRQATRPAPSLEVVADSMFDALVVLRALRDDAGTITDFAFDYASWSETAPFA